MLSWPSSPASATKFNESPDPGTCNTLQNTAEPFAEKDSWEILR
jgi:hypothetical protein